MKFASRRAPLKVANDEENIVLLTLRFKRRLSAANFQARQAQVMKVLMRALQMVNLMLALNCSLNTRVLNFCRVTELQEKLATFVKVHFCRM
jgi:hypothetical protein